MFCCPSTEPHVVPPAVTNAVDVVITFQLKVLSGVEEMTRTAFVNKIYKGKKLQPYLFTDFLPWNRVLLGKLTGSQLVHKFTAFYGPQKFITTFTSDGQLSLSNLQPRALLILQQTGGVSRPGRLVLEEMPPGTN